MGDNNLKLYVWENVLTDWTDGIMFALAANEDEARELIINSVNEGARGAIEKDLRKHPLKVSKPKGFVVYGGT